MKNFTFPTIGRIMLSWFLLHACVISEAQQVQYWKYKMCKDFQQTGADVDCDVTDVYFRLEHAHERTLNNKTYEVAYWVYGMVITSQHKFNVQEAEYDGSLGVRREGGRVYVDKEEYLAHLSRGFDFSQPSFGTPDYLPYPETYDGELILYDYNKEVGEKYAVSVDEDIIVEAKDNVTLSDNTEHRRLTLSNGLVLIEGIGCINSDGLLFDYLYHAKGDAENFSFLEQVTEYDRNKKEETILYEYLPDWLQGISSVVYERGGHGVFFDLQGRRQAGASHGVSIVRGADGSVRKVILSQSY